ncbi:MAG: phage tail sheath family protein [Pyrinomonadaceae bacterium]
MPVAPTYPGIYIEEVPSGVRTITGVPTSITAFVGSAPRGPVNEPQFITSFADYERLFGGLTAVHPMSYSVFQYYQNGGSEAIIVRLVGTGAAAASIELGDFDLEAKYSGTWGAQLRARVDYDNIPSSDTASYNLTIRDVATGEQERYLMLVADPNAPRAHGRMLQSSSLIKPGAVGAVGTRPSAHSTVAPGQDPFSLPNTGTPPPYAQATGGNNGAALANDAPTTAVFSGNENNKTGLYALLKTDIFNMLVLPPLAVTDGDPTLAPTGVQSLALTLCLNRRAMLLVDAPNDWDTVDQAVTGGAAPPVSGDSAKNAALYFPYLRIIDPDPAQGGRLINMPASGAVAGIYARTDVQRGVWKAPAGTDASLNGVPALSLAMTDLENGRLNPLGVNCLRSFPIVGRVVWGARTLRGADQLASEWKYVPVRRLALFIEESLYRGTKWVVFEPNDEPLWAQIRTNVGAFMQNLFRQGAFQGTSPRDAYFVKCDKDTTTQNHINLGIVNIHVGFAPLKPAEFVIIKIQQMAGQVEV